MPQYPKLALFIDGQWRQTDQTIPVVNPAAEEIIGELPVARQSDLDDALAAAKKGLRKDQFPMSDKSSP